MSVSQVMLLCLPCLHVAMFCPSYCHSCDHLVTEVPWPWHLRHRCHDSSTGEWYSRGVPVSYYIMLAIIRWGVWVHPSFHVYTLQGDCGVCSTPLHMELIPPPRFQEEVTPLVYVEAAPQLHVYTARYHVIALDWARGKIPVMLCYVKYILLCQVMLCYVMLYALLSIMFLMTLMFTR